MEHGFNCVGHPDTQCAPYCPVSRQRVHLRPLFWGCHVQFRCWLAYRGSWSVSSVHPNRHGCAVSCVWWGPVASVGTPCGIPAWVPCTQLHRWCRLFEVRKNVQLLQSDTQNGSVGGWGLLNTYYVLRAAHTLCSVLPLGGNCVLERALQP